MTRLALALAPMAIIVTLILVSAIVCLGAHDRTSRD